MEKMNYNISMINSNYVHHIVVKTITENIISILFQFKSGIKEIKYSIEPNFNYVFDGDLGQSTIDLSYLFADIPSGRFELTREKLTNTDLLLFYKIKK